jgi:hypothetical protein
MIVPRDFNLKTYEQTALSFLGRAYKLVPGTGKVAIVQADIASIARTVMRFSTVSGAFGIVTKTQNAVNVPVAGAVFNTMQTDSAWSTDTIGYNFADTIPATAFPGMGQFSAVYTFTPSGSNFSIFPLILRINCVSLESTLAEG